MIIHILTVSTTKVTKTPETCHRISRGIYLCKKKIKQTSPCLYNYEDFLRE